MTLKEDAEVLAFLTAKLEARSNSNLELLDGTFNLVKSNLESNNLAHSSDVESRRVELGALEASNRETRGLLEKGTTEVEGVAERKRQVSVGISFEVDGSFEIDLAYLLPIRIWRFHWEASEKRWTSTIIPFALLLKNKTRSCKRRLPPLKLELFSVRCL